MSRRPRGACAGPQDTFVDGSYRIKAKRCTSWRLPAWRRMK
jgi:hypothetical protein